MSYKEFFMDLGPDTRSAREILDFQMAGMSGRRSSHIFLKEDFYHNLQTESFGEEIPRMIRNANSPEKELAKILNQDGICWCRSGRADEYKEWFKKCYDLETFYKIMIECSIVSFEDELHVNPVELWRLPKAMRTQLGI
jgi:hypothetical protein